MESESDDLDSGNIFQVERSRFSDVFDVKGEREGGVQKHTQAGYFWGKADGTAVHSEQEISKFPEQRLGGHNLELIDYLINGCSFS
ncbi:hypothetical protein ABVT39_019468, partial [Epinephelus coioides]